MLHQVRALKKKAVSFRNRGKHEQALQALDAAVALLKSVQLDPGLDAESVTTSIRAELADTFGMRGGIHRRRRDLAAALADYRSGLELEQVGESSTYNLGNVIVLS